MQKKKTVLIVEDDPDIKINLKHILEMEGYLVFVAENGKEALEKLNVLQRTGYPCLVLTDLMMPGINGIELIKAMKSTKILISIPVIVMTASDDIVKNVKIIRKPFHIENLLRVVDEHCKDWKE